MATRTPAIRSKKEVGRKQERQNELIPVVSNFLINISCDLSLYQQLLRRKTRTLLPRIKSGFSWEEREYLFLESSQQLIS
jgi:hypothetical protein